MLIFSEHANTSEHVMSEVERAVSHHKGIFPLRIAHAMPSSELARRIINGTLELLHTGAPWRDLPKAMTPGGAQK